MILALYIGKEIFIPLVISLLLAAMLWPMATWMHQAGIPLIRPRRRPAFPWVRAAPARWRMPWGLATVAVITILIAVIAATAVSFSLGLSKIFVDLGNPDKQGDAYRKIHAKLVEIGVQTDDHYLPPDPDKSEVLRVVRSFFTLGSGPFQDLAKGFLFSAGAILWQSILILFILLFLLLEGKMLSRRVVEIFGPHAAVQGK